MKTFGLVRLTKDPQYHNGTTKFSVAWNHYNGEGQFFNCVAFKGTGEQIYNNVKKGQRIVIYGNLVNNNWTKDGVKHYSEQIIVNSFEFIEPKQNTTPHVEPVVQRESIDVSEDDLPF